MKTSVPAYLSMRGITKFYQLSNVLANDRINFELAKNEINAIVGENGAGKTTLMKILYGLERSDEGQIFLNEQEVTIHSPLDANRLGIGMVHQHFRLIPEFTIAENVTLGIEPVKHGVFFNHGEAVQRVQKVMDEFGFDLDPKQKIARLTVGQKQQVEIIKILYRKADLLILDEPTSALTEQQIQKLFDTLRNLCQSGRTIIIITHKLGEVKALSHRVTVMRKGRIVAVRDTADVDEKELSRLMVGKSISFKFARQIMPPGKIVLELQNILVKEKGRDRPLLDRVSLMVHEGEILAMAGVGGNGLGELEEVVSGLRTVSDGTMLHKGEEITNLSAFVLRERGLAYVPADRLYRGSCLESSVLENMIISNHHSFLKGGVINQNGIQDFGRGLKGHFSIDGELEVPIGTLSGGNIQKVILARELSSRSDFIIFSEPTWGLDVVSSEFVYEKILECRSQGAAILLISSNLDEVLSLADTLIVMYRGRIVAKFHDCQELSKELIGEYMLGIRDDFKEGS